MDNIPLETKIEVLPIDSIQPHKGNAKVHTDKQIEHIKNSIRAFGFNDPLGIWSDKNIVVEGHGRLIASQELGMTEIPCIRLDHLCDKQRRAYMLTHNQTTMSTGWDWELFDVEFGNIEIDMSGFGFGIEELEDYGKYIDTSRECGYKNDSDEIPDIDNTEPIVQRGDIITIADKHRLMCGDCTGSDDVEKLMDGAKADLIFTDPPYNVNYSNKNEFLNNHDKGNRIQKDIEGDTDGDDERVGKELWAPAFQNMYDNAKDHCSIYVTMPQGGAHMMMMMMISKCWKVKHELIWFKNNHVLGRVDYLYKHEPILFGWKKTHKFYGKGNHQKSVWEIDKPLKSDLHPTMKPVELVENALLNSSKKGDIVLDLFLGSGTTIIAAEKTGRTCFGMEIDARYCDVIIKRYIDFTGKDDITVERDGKKYEWSELATR